MKHDDPFLQEALAIADRLCSEAIFHRGTCNWMTREVPYRGQTPHETRPRLQALNPSIYSGTAGIALFLARLGGITDDPAPLRTATAAMLHAVRHAHRVDDGPLGQIGGHWRFGFYLGTLGIAWAAHEVGLATGDPLLAPAARSMVAALADGRSRAHETDLIFGNAGGIPALLRMAEDGVPGSHDLAVDLGQDLLDKAERSKTGWSWRSMTGDPQKPNLTGFSHGTAGIGWALARLSQATGEERFAEGAEQAFSYERNAFLASRGNWPNFQTEPDADGNYAAATSWCHGAPGIGVSRAALPPPLFDKAAREELAVARTTTETRLREQLAHPGQDFMLCHGVAGNAECLWLMESRLGVPDALDRARAVGRYGIERFGKEAAERWGPGHEWPTGVTAGIYPPLVTGVAGVGHWYLRLAYPTKVPSILVPGVGM